MNNNDLISKAAAIKEIEPMRYSGDFISTLIHLPAVDAVPIWWLQEKIRSEYEPDSKAALRVLRMWEKAKECV